MASLIINNKTLNITNSLYNSSIHNKSCEKYISIVDITTYQYTDGSDSPNPEINCFAYDNITYKLIGQLELKDFTDNILDNGTYNIIVYNGNGVFANVKNVIVDTYNNCIKINLLYC